MTNTGSNYYMNFNLKGRESALFDLQAVAVKGNCGDAEEVEIVITRSLWIYDEPYNI